MKASIAIALAIVTTISSASASPAGPRDHHGWRCNAYGIGGPRNNTWETVTGGIERTEASAKQDAEAYCSHSRHLNACRTSGCWPE